MAIMHRGNLHPSLRSVDALAGAPLAVYRRLGGASAEADPQSRFIIDRQSVMT
jgi:hypothetical protein